MIVEAITVLITPSILINEPVYQLRQCPLVGVCRLAALGVRSANRNDATWWLADIAPVDRLGQNHSMVAPVNFERVRWALEELSSEGEQRRLWLSNGNDGSEVSSFTEARCGLFDDSRLGIAFDKKQSVFGEPTDDMFARLDALLHRVDGTCQPETIITNPVMVEVRILAALLLKRVPLR